MHIQRFMIFGILFIMLVLVIYTVGSGSGMGYLDSSPRFCRNWAKCLNKCGYGNNACCQSS